MVLIALQRVFGVYFGHLLDKVYGRIHFARKKFYMNNEYHIGMSDRILIQYSGVLPC